MKKKIVLFICLLLCSVPLFPQSMDFVQEKFSDFLTRFVVEEDKELFAHYYFELSKKMTDSNEAEASNYFIEKALVALEAFSKNLLDEIRTFLKADSPEEEQVKLVRIFLRRYGAYQEFLEAKNIDIERENSPVGIFASVGNFFSKIGSTIAGWFSSTSA